MISTYKHILSCYCPNKQATCTYKPESSVNNSIVNDIEVSACGMCDMLVTYQSFPYCLQYSACSVTLTFIFLPGCSLPEPTQCPSLSNPSNGVVEISTLSVGGVARYSCLSGYSLVGSSSRTCQSDGSWSGQQPSCKNESCKNEINSCLTNSGL